MKRIAHFSLILIAASGISYAQSQSSGGWRRVGDPPPAQTQSPNASPLPAPAGPADQDPTQPVARADEYGQPQSQPPQDGYPQPGPQGNQGPARRPNGPPAPAYGLPPQVTIPAGTFVTIRVNQPLSSDHNQQGDFFSATLVQPLVVDGIVLAQRGQTVTGRVAEAVKAGRAQGTSHLALQLTGLSLADGSQVPVQSQMVSRNGQTSVGQDVAAVGTTTAVGAAIGAAADWGRGAAIGAGAGAAAGIVGVLLTRGHETVVYPETALTFRMETPVNVNLAHAPQAFRYVGPNEYDHPVDTQLARRPQPRPYGGYGAPYGYPYPSGPYYGGGYYPYYPYYGGIGVGVVIRGGRHGRRW